MDFDFSQIAVPFRMQPGLRRLAADSPQLTPLDPSSRLYGEKLAVLESKQSRWAVEGFDPAAAIRAIEAHARTTIASSRFDLRLPLELAFEEDLVVLDGATAALPWLCVCVPSHWAPEDKLGLSLSAVHAPVADNAALLAATRQLARLVTAGECWERYVWTVTPSPQYDQHPRRQPRAPWPEGAGPADFAEQCFFRCERQTFLPVGDATGQAVFTIRVMIQPLAEAIDETWKARRLRDALASMSDAVLAYKNLDSARLPLLRWLDSRN